MRNIFPVRYSQTMAVWSFEVDIAMLLRLLLWPTAILEIAAEWLDMVRIGELDGVKFCPAEWGCEKEIKPGRDHTCMLPSSEPDKIKLFVGSTTREVIGCKCAAGVETCRPVHIYCAS